MRGIGVYLGGLGWTWSKYTIRNSQRTSTKERTIDNMRLCFFWAYISHLHALIALWAETHLALTHYHTAFYRVHWPQSLHGVQAVFKFFFYQQCHNQRLNRALPAWQCWPSSCRKTKKWNGCIQVTKQILKSKVTNRSVKWWLYSPPS